MRVFFILMVIPLFVGGRTYRSNYSPIITDDGEWYGNGRYYKSCRWTDCGTPWESCSSDEITIAVDESGPDGSGCSYGNLYSRCCKKDEYEKCPKECKQCPYGGEVCIRWCSTAGWCGDGDKYNAKSLGTDCTQCPGGSGGLKNAGKDCWGPCNYKQGTCAYCGTGVCCRKGWRDKTNGCDGSIGGNGHRCVAKE